MADVMYGGGGDYNEEIYKQRKASLFIGNLTWWTTDQDVINMLINIGVTDAQEVKFFENRANGQSKGFCAVTFLSEASLPIVTDKLPKLELHGQNPVVSPYNKQNLNLFESQTTIKPRPHNNSTNGPNHISGISAIGGMHGPSSNYSQPPNAVGRGYRPAFDGNIRPQMRSSMPIRPMRAPHPGAGPLMPGHGQLGRMPHAAAAAAIQQQAMYNQYIPGAGGPPSGASYPDISQYYRNSQQPQQAQPQQTLNDNIMSSRNDSEFEELMNKNRNASKMALDRARQDSDEGRHQQGMDTLATAITLIKASKVADDERTQFLISTLENELDSIESKYYGRKEKSSSSSVRARSRSRDRDRERDRERGERDNHRDRDRERTRDRDRDRSDRDRDRDRGDTGRASDRDRVDRVDAERSERRSRDDRDERRSSSKRDKSHRSSGSDRKDRKDRKERSR